MNSNEQAFHEKARTVAGAFVAARREKRALITYPGEAPADLAAAYTIQDLAIGIDGRTIGDGKRGPVVERLQGLYRELAQLDSAARAGVRLA